MIKSSGCGFTLYYFSNIFSKKRRRCKGAAIIWHYAIICTRYSWIIDMISGLISIFICFQLYLLFQVNLNAKYLIKLFLCWFSFIINCIKLGQTYKFDSVLAGNVNFSLVLCTCSTCCHQQCATFISSWHQSVSNIIHLF